MTATTGTQTPATAPPKGPARGRTLGAAGLLRRALTLREASIVVITVIAFVYFSATTSRFLTGDSFKSLLPFFTPYAILAAGEVFVMINGEIDLSIGAMTLFIPFWFHQIHNWGVPLYPALILALVSAALIGAANGFAVAYVGIASFVATLGTLFTLDGLTLVMSHATPVNPPGTSISSVSTFSQIFGRGTYSELFWAIGIVIVLQLVLTFSRWGIYTVAVGGNRLGAAEAGIKVRLMLIRNFAMCALLAGFVGVLETVRSTTITPDPSGSFNYLLLGIAAAVIGGTLLQGGSGTVVGALIGGLFLGILYDGLTFKGVNANYQDLYLGIAILIAMVLNTYIARVRTRSGHG